MRHCRHSSCVLHKRNACMHRQPEGGPNTYIAGALIRLCHLRSRQLRVVHVQGSKALVLYMACGCKCLQFLRNAARLRKDCV